MKIKHHIASIILLAVLLTASIGTYLCYPLMNQAIQRSNYKSSDISNYILLDLPQYCYGADYLLRQKENSLLSLDDYNPTTLSDSLQEELYYNFQYPIEEKIKELNQNEDIFYHIVNTQTKQELSNTSDQIEDLNENITLQKQYQWYLQVQFDKNGKPTLIYISDENQRDQSLISQFSYQLTLYDTDANKETTVQCQPIKNVTITFAVSQQLHLTSNIGSDLFNTSRSQFYLYSFPYMFIAIAFCGLITLFIPMNYLQNNRFLSIVIQIKFGFLAIIWGFLTIFMYLGSAIMIAGTIQDQFQYIYQKFGIEYLGNYITPVINITYFFVFYLLFVIFVYFIKYLFHKGFKSYCKENTCIGWIMINGYSFINKVIQFDFDDSINKVVLKIVLFNLLIIAGCSIFFVFGIFFAFIYSVIIFVLIKKKFTDIQKDYQTLLKATKQLSQGHFDIQINQDIGIFNPLKDEFVHIKDGFEKAVDREVKSQKMKTELISNVSHDLKTPLTSIITYVDLLKNKEISKDNQNHYLDILERNALRLKNLIEDLFEVSRANSGDVQLELVDIDIISLIKQAQLECQDKLEEKSLMIKWNSANDRLICHLDSSKTYRIFENLFMNMSKYAMSNTRVYIDIIEQDNQIQIIFKNISQDEMTFNENEIVERFVQGDKSRNSHGSGLGLAIVKSFTELQGGQFHIELDGDLFKSIIIFPKQKSMGL